VSFFFHKLERKVWWVVGKDKLTLSFPKSSEKNASYYFFNAKYLEA